MANDSLRQSKRKRRYQRPTQQIPILSREQVLAMAPASAIHKRPSPYHGDTVTVRMADIIPDHVSIIRELYDFLGIFCDLLEAKRDHSNAADLDELSQFLAEHRLDHLAARCTKLRTAMLDTAVATTLRKVYHDIRGGSLSALLGHCDLIQEDEGNVEQFEHMYFLARDHRKIMRNAIRDLDTDGYRADLQPLGHSIELVREKWSADVPLPSHRTASDDTFNDDRRIRIVFRSDFRGVISESCLEFSSLDRVLYNLVSNASRHTIDDRVYIDAVALDHPGSDPNGDPNNDEHDTHLRFVVSNRITEPQHRRLLNHFGTDLGGLFRGGFTTGGNGLGMSICGDFITHSYGLPSLQHALSEGYLGAQILDDVFAVWFHWPAQRSA